MMNAGRFKWTTSCLPCQNWTWQETVAKK